MHTPPTNLRSFSPLTQDMGGNTLENAKQTNHAAASTLRKLIGQIGDLHFLKAVRIPLFIVGINHGCFQTISSEERTRAS